jgi:hypothetical protein
MKLIETKTLLSAVGSLTFSAIPQTFTDLVLLSSTRASGAVHVVWGAVRFNGNTDSVYSGRELEGRGSGGVWTSSYSTTFNYAFRSPGASATANTFNNGVLYIPNYTSSSFKSFSEDSVSENNTSNNVSMGIAAGLFSNTSPITSITCFPGGGFNFEIGCVFSLYGITKGSDGIVTTS